MLGCDEYIKNMYKNLKFCTAIPNKNCTFITKFHFSFGKLLQLRPDLDLIHILSSDFFVSFSLTVNSLPLVRLCIILTACKNEHKNNNEYCTCTSGLNFTICYMYKVKWQHGIKMLRRESWSFQEGIHVAPNF